MTKRAKKRALDFCGAGISFLLPAIATVAEFPRVKATTGDARGFLDVLNLSSAAFAIVAIIGVITAWRFFRDRVKVPRSGLAVSLVLYIIVRGVKMIIEPFETILFWSVIGCAVAWVLYHIADRLYKEDKDGAV